jgi:hypothetical protein
MVRLQCGADKFSGELLLDQQKYQESVERFDKSLELDKNRSALSLGTI